MKRSPLYLLFSFSILITFPHCTRKTGPDAGKGQPRAAVSAKSGTQKVRRIVFIGKAKACKCDQDRIDSAWKILVKALAQKKIPVKRLKMDRDGAETELYRSKRPFMVLPAVYFMGSGNKLIKMVQGWLRQDKLKSLLR